MSLTSTVPEELASSDVDVRSSSEAVRLERVSKHFPGVQALSDVTLSVARGEVHAIVGENGAGKSTLMNVLGGTVMPDSGTIEVHGRECRLASPADAQRLGIAFIHQEFSLFADLDVASNIFIRQMPSSAGFINGRALRASARAVLDRVGLEGIDPGMRLGRLRVGQQQLVEIARSLAGDTQILVLDEPTSSLDAEEVTNLFGLIRELQGRGVTVIYISHHLQEVFDVADRVTVMRDGNVIATEPTDSIDHARLVRMIVGHDIETVETHSSTAGSVALEVSGLSAADLLRDVSFTLRSGEILGVAGILGSGRTELLRCLFGLDPYDDGEISVRGANGTVALRGRGPVAAIRAGLALVTEDRRSDGLMIERSVRDNVVLAALRDFASRIGWMHPGEEVNATDKHVADLRIAAPSIDRLVKNLSGGNQQKVVLAKWLQTAPSILLLDDPTRGIDVGAKEEVYGIVAGLAANGTAALLVSSDFDELTRICDRVLILRAGSVVAELSRPNISTYGLVLQATGEDGDSAEELQ